MLLPPTATNQRIIYVYNNAATNTFIQAMDDQLTQNSPVKVDPSF